jgi:uncharacterized protein YndB with AHSA1/START domain
MARSGGHRPVVGTRRIHEHVRELDVRPGGRFDVVMRAPDGTEFPNVYVIEQVEPGRRIVWIHQGSEEHGLAPSRSSVEIVSVGAGPQSTVTLRAFYASEADRRRHLEDFHAAAGATQLLERLEQVAVAR